MTAFADVVDAAAVVAATRKRTAKRAALAQLLGRLAPAEVVPVIGFLTGEVRQGRIGIGWRTVAAVDAPAAPTPSLSVGDVDRAVTALAGLSGAGSQGQRSDQLHGLFVRATASEADFLARLLVGELRTGALEGVVTDAVAAAADIPATTVRRAAMLAGDLASVAALALGDDALADRMVAVASVGLEPGRAVAPMLASTAPSVPDAIAALAAGGADAVSVEWKLDGIRIQVHRVGDDVRIFTRNLNDITDRLPDVVTWARQLPGTQVVLDGEVLGVGDTGEVAAFQDTMRRVGRSGPARAGPATLRARYFDILHRDGTDLIDEPLRARLDHLGEVVGDHRIPGRLIEIGGAGGAEAGGEAGEQVLDAALAEGHEGVMVKDAGSSYAAGRRGKAWRKVKPVHTLDLVVLAVEPGSGRRRGWLSNIHLGARGEDGFVMVGKTFKGMTDEMLAWQTERFRALALADDEQTSEYEVRLRPAQVVEIAVDGVQRSTRYPGGVALRFARVVRYRDDKDAVEADTIETVRALGRGSA